MLLHLLRHSLHGSLFHRVEVGRIVQRNRHALHWARRVAAWHCGVARIVALERELGCLRQREHDSHHCCCLEERRETLADMYRLRLHLYLLWLVNHGHDTLVEVVAEAVGLRFGLLVVEERTVLSEFLRHAYLTEERAQYLLFLKRGLAIPVAFQKLVYIFIVHIIRYY